MKQKGFAHLLLIVIIGIVLAGGYFAYTKGYIQANPNPNKHTGSMSYASPTQMEKNTTVEPTQSTDETKDWKTYTNKTAEYSFKYPTNWISSTTLPNDLKDYVSLSDPKLSEASSPVFAVQLWDMSFEDTSAKVKHNSGSQETEYITFKGSEGRRYEDSVSNGPGPGFTYMVLPLKEKSVVIIYTSAQEKNIYLDTIDKILLTFKFTN